MACRHVGVVCVGVGGGVRWSVGCVVVSVGWQSVHGSVGVCAVCRYVACSVCVMVWLWCDVIMWCGLLLLLLGWCVLLTGGGHMGGCAVCNRARLSWHLWLVGAVRDAQHMVSCCSGDYQRAPCMAPIVRAFAQAPISQWHR